MKSEDLKLYDLSDEENLVHLDETMTIANLKFCDGQKILVESEYHVLYTNLAMQGGGNYFCMLRFLCNLSNALHNLRIFRVYNNLR